LLALGWLWLGLVWVGFEFGLLIISIINLSSRYCLITIDNYLPNGLTSKGLLVMLADGRAGRAGFLGSGFGGGLLGRGGWISGEDGQGRGQQQG
jgi:hypothetical protein